MIVKPPTIQSIQTPLEHAIWLQGARGSGNTVLMVRDSPNGKMKSYPVKPEQMTEKLSAVDTQKDVYLTLNRFFGRTRRSEHLQELNAVWADLDYYKEPRWASATPEEVMHEAFTLLDDRGIVRRPHLVYFSGRGIALVWLITPLPDTRLEDWREVQQTLLEVLKPLGSDRQATDPSRVLRLIGSTNSKSGEQVRVLWQSNEPDVVLRNGLADYRHQKRYRVSPESIRKQSRPFRDILESLWNESPSEPSNPTRTPHILKSDASKISTPHPDAIREAIAPTAPPKRIRILSWTHHTKFGNTRRPNGCRRGTVDGCRASHQLDPRRGS